MAGLATRVLLYICAACRAAAATAPALADTQLIHLTGPGTGYAKVVRSYEDDLLPRYCQEAVGSFEAPAELRSAEELEAGLPKLLLVGAQKSGTTFLRSVLATHASLGTCWTEQLNESIECGFLLRLSDNLTQDQFKAEYASKMLTKARGGPVLFDDRPDYLGGLGDLRIELLTLAVPKAHFVVTMRDPVPRMLSAMATLSCLDGTARNRCLSDEHFDVLERLPEDSELVSFGLYARHLKRWMEYVPKERIQTFFFHEVTSNPLVVVNQILTRIGLDTIAEIPEGIEERLTIHPDRCLSEECGAPFKATLRAQFKKPDQCEKLSRLYSPENRELAELTGSEIPLRWSQC